MLCDHCKKNQASCRYTQYLNGSIVEHHLCAECAEHLGIETMMNSFSEPLQNMLSSVFGTDRRYIKKEQRMVSCPCCGATFEDIVTSGRIGCWNCYDVFFDALAPSLRRFHSTLQHTGKVPAAAKRMKQNHRLSELDIQLKKAAARQDYDEIVRLWAEMEALKKETGEAAGSKQKEEGKKNV